MPKHHQRGAPALRPKVKKEGTAAISGTIKSPRGKSGAPAAKVKLSAKRLLFCLSGTLILLVLFLFMKLHDQVSGSGEDDKKLRGNAGSAAVPNGDEAASEHDRLASMLEGAEEANVKVGRL